MEPQTGLFIKTDSASDVVLQWFGQPIDWLYFHAESYHLAAQVLFARSSANELRDTGSCPVVFLYRHSLELFLKELLINGNKILQAEDKPYKDVKAILNRNHQLTKLWDDLKELYELIDWSWDEELDVLGEIIHDFDSVDPRSFGFRYPVTKENVSNMPQGFRFDLRHFCERMDYVINTLDQINCGLVGTFDQL